MPSILVVDDEDQIRQLIRETLEQAGYHVTEARDGKEALQQYRLAPADLVIMDILMPRINCSRLCHFRAPWDSRDWEKTTAIR